jgi:tetratricopeptide (TPR) repeat protein
MADQKNNMFSALGTNWGLNAGPFTDTTGLLAPPSSGAPVTDPYRNAAIKMEGFADQFNRKGVDDSSRLASNLMNNAGVGLGSSPMRTSLNALNKDRQREYFDTMTKISSQAQQEQAQAAAAEFKNRELEVRRKQQAFENAYKLKQMSEDQYKHAVATNFQALGVEMDRAKFRLAMDNAKRGNRKDALKLMLEAVKIDADVAAKASELRTKHGEWKKTFDLYEEAMNNDKKAATIKAITSFGIDLMNTARDVLPTIKSMWGSSSRGTK